MGVIGFWHLSFLLTYPSRSFADRCTLRRHGPARHSVCADVGGLRDDRLALAHPDCVHDEFWHRDGKDWRRSIPRGLDREGHRPLWTISGIGWILPHDSCSYAADVKSGCRSRHASDIGEDCSRTETKPENLCGYGYLCGFVLFSDATRASLRAGLYTRTLSLFGLLESRFTANNRGICDCHMVSPGLLAVPAIALERFSAALCVSLRPLC